jgi:hypothetical protein
MRGTVSIDHDERDTMKQAVSRTHCAFCAEEFISRTVRKIDGAMASVCGPCIVLMHSMMTPDEIKASTPDPVDIADMPQEL